MIADLKQLLFSILESAYQTPDISATQQMGVNMSNAVKKDGVVIIQNQNVEVYAKVIPAVVKALKMCDLVQQEKTHMISYQPESVIEHQPVNAVAECCEYFYNNGIRWEVMQHIMKTRYLEYVTGKFTTKKQAAEWLGIGPTYLSKLTKTKGESND